MPTKNGKTGLISGCLHHSWQKLSVFSVEVPYLYLKKVNLVTASGPCLVSQVTMFAIDDVKSYKTQLSFWFEGKGYDISARNQKMELF